MKVLSRVHVARAPWVDVLIAVVLVAAAEFEIWLRPLSDDGIPGPRAVNAILFPLIAAPLAWRRQAPLVVLCVVWGAATVQGVFFDPSPQPPLELFLALVVALYSVARHSTRGRALVGAAVAAPLVFAINLSHARVGVDAAEAASAWLVFAVVWLLGRYIHDRAAELRRLRDRAAQAERTREERAQAAVTDERLVRAGLRMILRAEPDIDVVGEAGDGLEAVHATGVLHPDVVLMDIRMPVLDGVEATRRIVIAADSRSRVLVLTTFDLDEYVFEALRAGASGFLLKDAPDDQLVTAIRVVSNGGALFAASVTRRLVEQFVRRAPSRRAQPPGLAELTDRERQVLRLMARGLSNMEIAAELFLSEHTARTHVGHILAKLGLRDRVQAVVLAYESGIVQPGDD